MQPILQLALWAVVFMPAEALFALYPQRGRERLHNLLFLLFNSCVTAFVIAGIAYTLFRAGNGLVPATWRSAIAGQTWWMQLAEAAVLIDFGIYVSHRLGHSPFFWRFHEIHHSAEEMNWLVSFRNHPVDLTLYTVFATVPAALLGFAPGPLAAAKLIHSWQTLISHSNTRLSIGPLRHVLVGPAFHHWHHADEKSIYDSNFGALFVFWDALFGTRNLRTELPVPRFGTGGTGPRDFGDLLAGPFRPAVHSPKHTMAGPDPATQL